jgi:hypothetical protein
MTSWTEKRKLIRPDEDYDALLGSAHRHPALATGPLALIRYRCWWVEKNQTVGRPEGAGRDFDGDAALLKYCFETARKIILLRLGAEEDADFDDFVHRNAGQDHEDPTRPGVNSEYRYFSIPVKLGEGAVLRLTITQHDDRISMSEVLDLIPPDDASNYATPIRPGAEKKTEELMKTLAESVKEIKEILEALQKRIWYEGTDRVTSDEATRLLARCKWLQQTFWRHWPVGVFISTPATPAGEEMRLAADIRGLLVPKSLNLLQPPGSRDRAPHTLGPDAGVTAPFEDPMATVRQYWELIKAWEIARTGAPSVPSEISGVVPRPLSLSDREMVVCTALNGRAIYASSLGFGRDKGSDPAFISYVAIASTRNRRQLGRLVDRVSSMGMLRLLAVRDLPKLREASRVIRNLGPELTAIETRINTAEPSLNKDGSGGSEVRPLAEVEAELREFGRKLSAIGSDIRGGLPYRVARARLYAESYDNILQGMRIERIEGFMPYNEFIRRRVRENFSFISRLGDRHRQLLDRYRTTIELSQSISLRAIAGETNALAKSAHLVEFVAVTYYGSELLLKLSPLIESHGPSTFVKIACVVLAPVLWFAMRPSTLYLLHSLRKRLGRLGRSQSPSGTGST